MPTLEHSAKVFQYSKDQGNHSVGHTTQYSMSDVVEGHATIYVCFYKTYTKKTCLDYSLQGLCT